MWKRNQTMVHLLSQEPFVERTLFLNPALYLRHLLRSPRQELHGRRREAWRAVLPQKRDGVTLHSPVRLPFYSRNKLAWNLGNVFTRKALARFLGHPYILLLNRFQVWDDQFFPNVLAEAKYIHFDWSDDFETFCQTTEERDRMAEVRQSFLANADLVTTINERLSDRARLTCNAVMTVPNATDFELMHRAADPATEVPPEIAALTGPVIGYMGYLNSERLDIELLTYLATKRPDWNFVFLGPESTPEPLGKDLPALPNVHQFPPVPYHELPSWLSGFDVCIIPNRLNEHTKGNDPIKLYDYLATGKPIVATPTAGTEDFADLIGIAATPDAFVAALAEALEKGGSPARRKARLAAARMQSWPVRFSPIFSRIASDLAK